MSEGTVYEAAVEVRDALRQATEDLTTELWGLSESQLKAFRRRDRFAGDLMAVLVQRELVAGTPPGLSKPGRVAELAALAWKLADALDQGDPAGKSKMTSSPSDDDAGGIDLAKWTPEAVDEDDRRRSGQ